MGDEQKQDQSKPPPPPPPVLNQVIFATVALAAILSPILLLSGSGWLADGVARVLSGESIVVALGIKPAAGPQGKAAEGDGGNGDLELPPVDFAEVFRFDITPDWIVTRWPRVTASLSAIQLQGYRVPLVTGIAEDDLAGTVTYYFNSARQLQRITFEGTTGAPNRLLFFLSTYYGFVYRPTNNPGVYLFVVPEEGSRGETHSYVWIRPAAVFQTQERHQRFAVSLVIERPHT
ncbi:MAG: DUF6690 family protein [Thermogutta sp.]